MQLSYSYLPTSFTTKSLNIQRTVHSLHHCYLFILPSKLIPIKGAIRKKWPPVEFTLKTNWGGHNYCSCCLLASPASHAASSPDGTYNFYLHDIYLTLVILRHVLHKKHMILFNDLMQYYSTNLPRASTWRGVLLDFDISSFSYV